VAFSGIWVLATTDMDASAFFDESFAALTGHAPLGWQRRLFLEHFARGDIPSALDIPTGLGKTSR
jgi:CRISPR-associated endonuclease/helicase Cas3